ncbi:hypothetical protein M3J09_004785 [Ascochyta lentis]
MNHPQPTQHTFASHYPPHHHCPFASPKIYNNTHFHSVPQI